MNKYIKHLMIFVVIILGVVTGLNLTQKETSYGFGGGGETYAYKHITSSQASSTSGYLIKGGAGMLGSITVGSTSASVIRIYDGNSAATTSATLIGTLKASVAEQTFIYNAAVTKGVVLELISYNGSLTVGFK